jgi:hypothetical protein
MIVNYFVAACATLVSLLCVFLVLHQQYEDGLFGRAALAGISISGFLRAATLTENSFDVDLSWITVLLWVSAALFFSRHTFRFIRWTKVGNHAWPRHSADKQGMFPLK